MVCFDENHGGELQQANNDGTFAEVVLVCLSWTKVRSPTRVLTQMKTAFCCWQFMSCQFSQKEMNSFQKTWVLCRALRMEEKKLTKILHQWRSTQCKNMFCLQFLRHKRIVPVCGILQMMMKQKTGCGDMTTILLLGILVLTVYNCNILTYWSCDEAW